jgi:DNA polymerase III alpha subunit
MRFVHLHVHSPFSYLDGAARIDRLVDAAAELDMPALAITDHDCVTGAVGFER